jgi:hypothetical protein
VNSTLEASETTLVETVFERLASDLAMIADREFVIDSVHTKVASERAAGRGTTHISFKLGFRFGGGSLHGCLLVPLPDAMSLACYLMMVPDAGVESKRGEATLDSTTKDAMLEVGNFVAGATEAALRKARFEHIKIVAEGCQGVREGVRPAFRYREGDPLLIGKARARLHVHPEFEMVLIIPRLGAWD